MFVVNLTHDLCAHQTGGCVWVGVSGAEQVTQVYPVKDQGHSLASEDTISQDTHKSDHTLPADCLQDLSAANTWQQVK